MIIHPDLLGDGGSATKSLIMYPCSVISIIFTLLSHNFIIHVSCKLEINISYVVTLAIDFVHTLKSRVDIHVKLTHSEPSYSRGPTFL